MKNVVCKPSGCDKCNCSKVKNQTINIYSAATDSLEETIKRTKQALRVVGLGL